MSEEELGKIEKRADWPECNGLAEEIKKEVLDQIYTHLLKKDYDRIIKDPSELKKLVSSLTNKIKPPKVPTTLKRNYAKPDEG